jgi:hypothetical protein
MGIELIDLLDPREPPQVPAFSKEERLDHAQRLVAASRSHLKLLTLAICNSAGGEVTDRVRPVHAPVSQPLRMRYERDRNQNRGTETIDASSATGTNQLTAVSNTTHQFVPSSL